MSFSRPQATRSAPVPSPPTGTQVAAYATYAEAQQAVHYLTAEHFPVEHVTIVGSNLQSVERVTGRLSYGRVAVAGAMSGGWFGLFVGLLLSLFGGIGVTGGITFIAIALGAGFGLLFSVLSHAFSRGRRDFTSSSQIVAGQYAILCAPEQAGTAARLLAASPVGVGLSGAAVVAAVRVPTAPVVAPPVVLPRAGEPSATGGDQVGVGQVGSPTTIAPAGAAPAEPRKVDARWLTEDGKPRYGALAADHPDPVVVSTVAVPAVEGGEAPEPVAPPTQPGQPVVAVVSADESAVQKASVPDNPYAPPPANRR